MSLRKYNFVPGEFYHIYNRGTDKRQIFFDKNDYQRFQVLLHLANNSEAISLKDLLRGNIDPFDVEIDNEIVAIGAYCLMPNHFHLIVTPLTENGVSVFMQKLSTAYSMYFNKKYERSGSLFEGKFKSQLATDDRYLKYLFSYIHLNPVKLLQIDWKEIGIRNKKEAEEYLHSYKFSSYLEYVGKKRPESKILNSTQFPNYFEDFNSAEREIADWLSYSRGLASGIVKAEERLVEKGEKLTHNEVWKTQH